MNFYLGSKCTEKSYDNRDEPTECGKINDAKARKMSEKK